MSSFRASPWVPYDPTFSHSQAVASRTEMDEDVDMDAPQISTLHDQDTPPPRARKKEQTNLRKRRVPPIVKESWKPAPSDKNHDEFEEEEDQLIDELMDDDDDELGNPSPSAQSTLGRSPESPQKRKLAKRKPRKTDKKSGEGERNVKQKLSQPTGAHNLAPTMSCFKAIPTESHEDAEIINSSPMGHIESSTANVKKKVSPHKPPAIPRPKIKLVKPISLLIAEDAALLSESYAGTATSSPVTGQFFEQNTPEPENVALSSPQVSAPLVEESNFENIPIPVYPLPTKPFPVQPPQKIASGVAPLLPLDKSNRRVRRWREAQREIRGIAGGRWLARTWVGDKESDYATFMVANNAQSKDDKAPSASKTSHSIVASKAMSKAKNNSKAGSTATSASPSRAPSVIPEIQGNPITGAVRAPTKMRILQLAPTSEAGDSDMATAPEI